jgi:Mn2+/Fe2+ NRAMP family transporter
VTISYQAMQAPVTTLTVDPTDLRRNEERGQPMTMSQAEERTPPVGFKAKVRQVGPGLLAAAAGVGSGDLVATMVAGSEYGFTLLWAAVLGAGLKLALAEGVGRWHLASGSTLLDGWRRLGYWATVFFGVYIVIWGFIYGATAMAGWTSATGR